jgi:hypothetical protein
MMKTCTVDRHASSQAEQPIPPTGEEASIDGSEYAFGYVSKFETMELADPIFSAAVALAPDGHRGKAVLSRMLCGQSANQLIAAATAASYLMGQEDWLFTHEAHPISPTIAAALAADRMKTANGRFILRLEDDCEVSVHLAPCTVDAETPNHGPSSLPPEIPLAAAAVPDTADASGKKSVVYLPLLFSLPSFRSPYLSNCLHRGDEAHHISLLSTLPYLAFQRTSLIRAENATTITAYRAYNHDVEDYRCRSTLFYRLPPVLYLMGFYRARPSPSAKPAQPDEVKESDDLQRGPYQFSAMHPDNSRFITREKKNLLLPQFLRDPPVRPSDTSPAADREAYAEFILGNFVSDKDERPVGGTLWAQMRTWEQSEVDAPTAVGRIVIRMIENLNAQALGKARQRLARKAKKLKVNQLGKSLRNLLGSTYSSQAHPHDSNAGSEGEDDEEEDTFEQSWASVRVETYEEDEEGVDISIASGEPSSPALPGNTKFILTSCRPNSPKV